MVASPVQQIWRSESLNLYGSRSIKPFQAIFEFISSTATTIYVSLPCTRGRPVHLSPRAFYSAPRQGDNYTYLPETQHTHTQHMHGQRLYIHLTYITMHRKGFYSGSRCCFDTRVLSGTCDLSRKIGTHRIARYFGCCLSICMCGGSLDLSGTGFLQRVGQNNCRA